MNGLQKVCVGILTGIGTVGAIVATGGAVLPGLIIGGASMGGIGIIKNRSKNNSRREDDNMDSTLPTVYQPSWMARPSYDYSSGTYLMESPEAAVFREMSGRQALKALKVMAEVKKHQHSADVLKELIAHRQPGETGGNFTLSSNGGSFKYY